jgi:drug/metabolite transporter (DMT)-like permease
MLVMGICDAMFFLFTTQAFRLGNPAVMGIFSYQSLVYALLVDFMVFHMEVSLTQVLATLFIVFVVTSLGLYKY